MAFKGHPQAVHYHPPASFIYYCCNRIQGTIKVNCDIRLISLYCEYYIESKYLLKKVELDFSSSGQNHNIFFWFRRGRSILSPRENCCNQPWCRQDIPVLFTGTNNSPAIDTAKLHRHPTVPLLPCLLQRPSGRDGTVQIPAPRPSMFLPALYRTPYNGLHLPSKVRPLV